MNSEYQTPPIQTLINRSDEIKQCKTLFANTRMADTPIVCPICTVISSLARPDFVA